jgi:hypothetical protein
LVEAQRECRLAPRRLAHRSVPELTVGPGYGAAIDLTC